MPLVVVRAVKTYSLGFDVCLSCRAVREYWLLNLHLTSISTDAFLPFPLGESNVYYLPILNLFECARQPHGQHLLNIGSSPTVCVVFVMKYDDALA